MLQEQGGVDSERLCADLGVLFQTRSEPTSTGATRAGPTSSSSSSSRRSNHLPSACFETAQVALRRI